MAVDRQCLRERIRRGLIDQIVSGELRPGERLIETALARMFETSQTPVREALHDLEAMRMVESIPHRGIWVRSVTDEEMAEAYAVRGLLEEYAAQLAATSRSVDVSALRDHAAGMQVAAEHGDSPAYAARDFAFHRSIVEASANATLLCLWDSLAFEFRTPLMMVRHAPNLVTAAAEHFLVVNALEAGNGETAGRLLRKHAESFIPESIRKEMPSS